MIVSYTINAREALFLAYFRPYTPLRFLFITLILLAPLPLLPRLLGVVKNGTMNGGFFGEFTKIRIADSPTLSRAVTWLVRPLQGIGLSLIFAEKLLNAIELTAGASLVAILVRPTLFVVSSALVGLLLSTVWALDDLGVRIYNRKTGEVHMAGSTFGTIFPLLAGAIGVSALFQSTDPATALLTVIEIFMILYPPYVLFTIIHNKFITKHYATLSETLTFRTLETALH
jgi:hypothetical protein